MACLHIIFINQQHRHHFTAVPLTHRQHSCLLMGIAFPGTLDDFSGGLHAILSAFFHDGIVFHETLRMCLQMIALHVKLLAACGNACAAQHGKSPLFT